MTISTLKQTAAPGGEGGGCLDFFKLRNLFIGHYHLLDFDIAIPSFWLIGFLHVGHDTTKPFFGVSDKGIFKSVSSATETS